jgi:hypothetical protein
VSRYTATHTANFRIRFHPKSWIQAIDPKCEPISPGQIFVPCMTVSCSTQMQRRSTQAAEALLHALLRSAFIAPKETRPGKHFIFSGAQHLSTSSLRVLVVPFLISSASMAPVRGAKKRKRPEKPVPAPAPRLPLPPLPDGSDWWGAFYRRVAGRLSSPSPPSLAASLCSLEFTMSAYLLLLLR